ncbi:MAG: hypothetical protein ACWGON_07155, partial [Gemmatimonadota bacterium]
MTTREVPRRLPSGGGFRQRTADVVMLLMLIPLLVVAPPAAEAQDARTAGLELCLVPDSVGEQLRRIARRVGGDIGVSAVHLESGARISYNGDTRFPM